MKNKIWFSLLSIVMLAASCNLFGSSTSAGLIKTNNGGTDWLLANKVKDNAKASMVTLNISKLAFSPSNRQTVFAGSYTEGLFESNDAADSWSKILSKIMVYDFAISPIDAKVIFAAGFYADHGKVLKTTDGGASWVEIFNEATAADAVRAITLNPANPSQVVIGMTSGDVIKSNDSGISWQLLKNFNDRVNRVFWENNNIYVLLKGQGLWVSNDSGKTFTDLTSSLSKSIGFGSVSFTQSAIDNFSQMFVDPNGGNLIYMTTNKGLYKTVDAGKTWQLVPMPVQGKGGEPKAIAVSYTSSNIVYASVGSTVYKSTDGGQSWQTQSVQTDGFVNYILIDPQLPQVAYGGIYLVTQ